MYTCKNFNVEKTSINSLIALSQFPWKLNKDQISLYSPLSFPVLDEIDSGLQIFKKGTYKRYIDVPLRQKFAVFPILFAKLFQIFAYLGALSTREIFAPYDLDDLSIEAAALSRQGRCQS